MSAAWAIVWALGVAAADDAFTPVAPAVRIADGPAPGGAPPLGVVGGAAAPEGAWPDAVAVYHGSTFGCTGVLIAPDAVLTAGHCGWNVTEVVLGTSDHAVGGERIEVVETVVHEDYLDTYDVALLRLAAPATVAPRALALDCIVDDYLVDGGTVAIVGYGATDEWAASWGTTLNEAWTTVRDADCSSLTSGCNVAVTPGGELVAGGDGVDSCNGDSGGPLYLTTAEGDWLVGITSRAAIPASTPCGDGGIYVRADAIVPWVESLLGAPIARPDCEGNRAPQVTFAPIDVSPGGTAVLELTVDDPNPEDQHRFTIVEDPEQGWAQVSPDGAVAFAAPLEPCEDHVVVRVEDDGEPPMSVEIDIPVVVRWSSPPLPSRGCASAPITASWAWVGLALAALLRRRW